MYSIGLLSRERTYAPGSCGYASFNVLVLDLGVCTFTMSSTEESARHPRRTSSKYDFVKVKVWIGANSDHYYVLSRFLVSRMLTVTKVSFLELPW